MLSFDAVTTQNSSRCFKKASEAKFILNKCDLYFGSGFNAVMGPSGSGKTTLLSVITDSLPSSMEINDLQTTLSPSTIVYIPQRDVLHGFFTTRQYMLHYQALAGLPRDVDKVDKILEAFGLADHADVKIGDVFRKGLSGGQQRRVSVAIEVISEPDVLVLDEPTSGLDSASAYKLMQFLLAYCQGGARRTVILTIHQPSHWIWKLFTSVTLLSRGYVCYHGPSSDVEDFFDRQGFPVPPKVNRADWFVENLNDDFDRESGIHGEDPLPVKVWSKRFQEWKAGRASTVAPIDNLNPDQQLQRAQESVALRILLKRYFLSIIFNPGIFGIRFVMYILLALALGLYFMNIGSNDTTQGKLARANLLFFIQAFYSFMSIAVLPFFIEERVIMEKEVKNKYYKAVYYHMSLAIGGLAGIAVMSFCITVLIVPMTGLSGPVNFYLATFLNLFCAEAIAAFFALVTDYYMIALALIAFIYGFFMLVEGAFIAISAIPGWLQWTRYVAFHYYAFRVYMENEFGAGKSSTVVNGQSIDIRSTYDLQNIVIWQELVILLAYGMIVHLLCLLKLYLKYDREGEMSFEARGIMKRGEREDKKGEVAIEESESASPV